MGDPDITEHWQTGYERTRVLIAAARTRRIMM